MKLPDDRERFYEIANKAGLSYKQAEEMRAYALAYGAAVREACAKYCDQQADAHESLPPQQTVFTVAHAKEARYLASGIRREE